MFELLDGVKLLVEEDNVLAAEHRRSMGFEPVSRRVWKQLAARGGTVVDAGAYTGFYSVLATQSGAARVLAFEASPLIVPRLLANLELNDANNVVVQPHALNARSGQRITLKGKTGLSSSGSIAGDGAVIGSASTLALDDLALPELNAIKIDVERSELDLLNGAQDTIRRCRPDILIELLDDAAEVKALLDSWNYAGTPTDKDMFHYRPA